MPDRARVRVPATSANLGPAFDAMGLALGLHDELEVSLTGGALQVQPYGDVPGDERNLVVRALRAAFSVTGGQPPGMSVTYTARIPHARGLGSSAAAICAGVTAALALRGRSNDTDLALALATELEGHPDNVAACLLGGATIAWSGGGGPRAVRLEPVASLAPVVFVPAERASTARSRGALPDNVTHRDAAHSTGRAALLCAALLTDLDLLLPATEDRLHQPYRLPGLPASTQLLENLRAKGIAAVLSGSGPTVLALCRDEMAAAEAAGQPRDGTVATSRTDGFDVLRLPVDRVGCAVVEP